MKTSELTGAALDWAVAKCEGHEWRCPWVLVNDGYAAWRSYELGWGNWHGSPSTDWAHGGPIIEREDITVRPVFFAERTESNTDIYRKNGWAAHVEPKALWVTPRPFAGPTPLVAAMRCYVTLKLGDTVEIPEELK